jgi:hypothetical protein
MLPFARNKATSQLLRGANNLSAKRQRLEMGKKHCTGEGEKYVKVTDEHIVVRVCVKSLVFFMRNKVRW